MKLSKIWLKLVIFFLIISSIPLIIIYLLNTQIIGRSVLFMVTALVFIVNLILSFLSAKFLSNPISKLITAKNLIEKGNLDQKIEVKTGDEIETLANFMGLLTSHLKQSLQNLDQAKHIISAERNKALITLSSIADGVIAVDSNKNIIIFNRAAEKMTGLTFAQVSGKRVSEVIKLFDKQAEVLESSYCQIKPDFEGVTFSKNNLNLLSAANGFSMTAPKIINISVGQIKEGMSVNLGCILTLHDVTDERGLQEMQLDFVSMAAHELRTPLTSIKGYLSVFMDEN